MSNQQFDWDNYLILVCSLHQTLLQPALACIWVSYMSKKHFFLKQIMWGHPNR